MIPTRDDLEFDKFYKQGNALFLKTIDSSLLIATGGLDKISSISKFGLNADVGPSEVTVWDAGGMYEFTPTADILSISSTEITDTLTGTGARTISIEGLDLNYNVISEIIEMDGLSVVNTVNMYLRVARMIVMTAGSDEQCNGIITAKIGSIVKAQIDGSNNQTLMAIYTIPAGKTGYLMYGKASVGKGKEAIISFKARPLGGVFNIQHKFYVYEVNYDYQFQVPLKIPEKTDIKVDASCDIITSVSASFDLILIDNE